MWSRIKVPPNRRIWRQRFLPSTSPHTQNGELHFWEWEGDGLVVAGSVVGHNLFVVADVEVQLALQLVLVEVESWYDFSHK